jgi:DNA repair ATPase RecN
VTASSPSPSNADVVREALGYVVRSPIGRVAVYNGACDALSALEAEAAEARTLREAIASAMASLATGPAKDGYAYALLDAALAGATSGQQARYGFKSLLDEERQRSERAEAVAEAAENVVGQLNEDGDDLRAALSKWREGQPT